MMFVGFLFMLFAMETRVYADLPQLSPHFSDFEIGPIPEIKFKVTRDSEINNSQNACIHELRRRLGPELQIWALEARAAAFSSQTMGPYYRVYCQVAYFDSESDLQRSVLTLIEKRLNYVSYLDQKFRLPRVIGQVLRKVSEPFFQVEIRSMEPHQNLISEQKAEVRSFVSHSMKKFQDHLELTLVASNESKVEGVLLVPLRFQDPLVLQVHRKTYELVLAHSGIRFPKTFKWGVATSGYQIEGGNVESDWYQFEEKPGSIFRNHRSDQGPDHWNRVRSDVALLKKLGVQQYRMSIEWSRIQPKENEWDLKAVQHYRDEIQLLLQHQIEPIVTLWHSTLPLWVSEKGGWEWEGIAPAFAQFSSFVYQKIAPEVKIWVTLNEPFLYTLGGYVRGAVPPGKIGGISTIKKPLMNLLRAHAQAYRALKEIQRYPIRIGIAHRMDEFVPYTHFFWDSFLAKQADVNFNWALPMALLTGELKVSIPGFVHIEEQMPEIKNTQDFYGLNYYTRFALEFQWRSLDVKEHARSEVSDLTEMGWEMHPEGFYETLKAIHGRFKTLPILILENGIADSWDSYRSQFIRSHLVYLHYAIEKGIPVENYCYWSLYDNFEWDQGFSIHVGLYEFDAKTKERKARPSAEYFSNIIKKNGILLQN